MPGVLKMGYWMPLIGPGKRELRPRQLGPILGLHQLDLASISVGLQLGAIEGSHLLDLASIAAVNSLIFSSTTSHVDCGLYTPANGSTNVSWSYWVKPSTAASRIIWARQAPQFNITQFLSSGDNRIRIAFSSMVGGAGSQNWTSGAADLAPTTAWTHWAHVYDGGGADNAARLKTYRNGVDVTANGAFSGTVGTAMGTFLGGAAELRFGYDGIGQRYSGRLCECALWPARSLTAAEVLEIYTNGRGGDIAVTSVGNPVNYWRLHANYQDTGSDGAWDGVANGADLSFGP